MKTLLEILTDPHPSPRDVFIIQTARAIVEKYPKSAQSDSIAVSRALCSAIKNDVYPVPLAPTSYGLLFTKIVEMCTLCRRYGQ